MSFDERQEAYRQQHTVSGERTQRAIEKMVDLLNERAGLTLKAGTVKPIINAYTGKITDYFYER